MDYQPRDRPPFLEFGYWDETIQRWHREGLPRHVDKENAADYFGLDFDRYQVVTGFPVSVGLEPPFEELVIDDRGAKEVFQQADGSRVLRHKTHSSIPLHLDYLLTDRQSWREHYLPRLDPDTLARFPDDWDDLIKAWDEPDRSEPIFLWAGSLYGKLRDWMGLENISYVIYDDPLWFNEMVTTLADCTIGALTKVLESEVTFDACGMWEDMAYKSGPLISPKHFKKYLSPHYRRISDLLRRHGVEILWVDCDGNIEKLVPLWLECGVNCVIPFEVGTWGADPLAYRRIFGKDLRMMGGFNKRILAGSKAAIEAEVIRLAQLVKEGGYIGFCDHYVPPDVSLENYLFYLDKTKQYWGN
jgi:uroporphyrinogen decarboxylase